MPTKHKSIFLWIAAVLLLVSLLSSSGWAQSALRIDVETILRGDSDWDWTQVRTAVVAGDAPLAITTMSRTAKTGTHGYHDVFVSSSKDIGETWTEPTVVPSLKRRKQADGYEVVAGDLWPEWHQSTGTVLITGKTFSFEGGRNENILREQVSYACYDPVTDVCGPLRTVKLPEHDHSGEPIIAANAGCHQRVTLLNGDILLPIRYQRSDQNRVYTTIVARCRFDGTTLAYIEHGSEHSISSGRGLYEPSVTEHAGQYFLTMRSDDGAYVAKSKDGIHYADHVPWKFDDGQPLGSYNTQQHWAIIGERLYLIYTRRGANNDHIMRHRAPLFIAEVDPHALHVLRATEQVLIPENDATLGNFGVCRISDDETWVTVAEGRVSQGPRKGETNKVFLAKIFAE